VDAGVDADAADSGAFAATEDATEESTGLNWINGMGLLQEAWVASVGISPAWMRSESLAI
jgi:hypothetical protein